jgi:glycosyltransferase involved in cell wall biosynthesis
MIMTTTEETRISAVVTAYNCAAFIAEAIDSILAQTRPVDEIVVIDDGSTDETAQVVASYATSGVRYVRQENQGAGAARNRGIQETKGELIAFLDGDDIWLPDKIAKQLDYLTKHPDVVLVSGYQWWWDVGKNERKIKPYGLPPHTDIAQEILVQNVVGNPSMVLMRRWIIDKVGLFNPGLRWGQDWEFWIRMVASEAKIGFIPEPVIIYRWHRSNLSHDRQWERLACFFGISRQSIRSYKPAWRRPVLLARAWSRLQWNRAMYGIKHDFSRRQQLWYAGSALVVYPFERSMEKVKIIGRVIIGEKFYRQLRAHPGLTGLRQHG